MAIDNDLSALLPDPPAPRPARREAAIDEALRRFDGGSPQAPTRALPEPARSGWGRPQIAALASVALVVLVSVPIWWTERDRIIPQVPPRAATTPVVAAAPSPAAPQQSAGAVRATPTPAAAPTPAEPDEPAGSPSSAAIESNLNRLPQFAPAQSAATAPADAPAVLESSLSQRQAAPAPAAPAQRAAAGRAEAEAQADARQTIVVTGSRVQRSDFNSTSPVVTVNEELLDDGDWNTCTLHDPRRDADACRALIDPIVRGVKARASAQLADGLALAWQGELDGAIEAFDRAIATAPDLSIAYLNRGLAYQEQGDLRRALADLNRAVARDPGDARAYYHRSQLHRARGDTKRADADARRAAELGRN